MRIHLLPRSGKSLNRELFKPFPQPIQVRGSSGIFKRKNEINALLGSLGRSSPRTSSSHGTGGRLLRNNGSGNQATKGKYAKQNNGMRGEDRLLHAQFIVAEACSSIACIAWEQLLTITRLEVVSKWEEPAARLAR